MDSANFPNYDPSAYEKLPIDRRNSRRMTDEGREALGMKPLYHDDEKIEFVSTEAVNLSNKIYYSDLQKPLIVRKLEDMILQAYVNQKITEEEANGLVCYIEEVLVYQENQPPARDSDARERQHKD